MRFSRVRLESFKCYGEADLRLERGVTVIHGLNGSGKSSLLEACFFALYGAKALDETLDEVVSIGAEDCEVEVWFTHGGGDYHVHRRVRATGERATTAKCVLETPEGTFEGARDVRRRVSELLRMDHEAFVNCAYVRQGEVNKLINASPADRQDMLDDLLQLGKLEEYRERASDARVGVGRVRDDKQGALAQLDEQIQAKEERDLHERLNGLKSDLAEVQGEIEHVEGERETAVQTREEAVEVLEAHEEKRAELDAVEDDIEELQGAIRETEREREQLDAKIREHRTDREQASEDLDAALAETDLEEADPEAVEAAIADLDEREEALQERLQEARLEAQEHASEAESLREDAADAERRATEKREAAEELESDIATARETLADRRERLDALAAEIADREARFEDAPTDPDGARAHRESVAADLDEAKERRASLEASLEETRKSLAEAEDLRDAGKCPECGQDVEGSPHVDRIAAYEAEIEELEADLEGAREEVQRLQGRLDEAEALVEAATELANRREKRDSVAQLVEEKAASLEADEARVEELREAAEDLEAQAEKHREAASEAEERADAARETVGECNREKRDLTERRERLERVADLLETIEAADEEIERLREKRDHKAEVNDERRDRLQDKRDRREELAAAVEESRVEEARANRDRAEAFIEQADEKLAELRERRDDLQGTIGGVENELEELESLRERREDLAETVERLDSLYAEAEQLQELYGNLRAELRQRNVETLERMLNDVFDLVYQNDSYSHIELDGEYQLTVFQKDGETLEPEQLSGGERALFNLSLRCAIYRLLAEGIEGAAPMPPLILDEPTVFLDSGHVSQLLDLVAFMRDDVGVEQIIVVSHDEELVGAADALVRVEKDSTTNRSSVERVEAGLVEQVAD